MGAAYSERASVRRLTPPGTAGVAVLSVEGAEPIERLDRLFTGALPRPGRIAYGELRARVVDGGSESEAHGAVEVIDEVIDEVLVVRLPGADSFEVHLHGSPALVADVIDRLSGGAAPAPAQVPLRFAERALAGVPTCPSLAGARILLDQAHGAMARELDSLRALSESQRAARLAELVRAGRVRARLFRESVVAIVGPVNAGKSTLFNVLVGEGAASVSAEEGTTRDVLSERVRFGPWPVRLLDTAGERDLSRALGEGDRRAAVESAGQRLGAEVAARADWVLRLAPAGDTSGAPERKPERKPDRDPGEPFVVTTRCAESFGAEPQRWPAAGISALEAPEHAREIIAEGFTRAFALPVADDLHRTGDAIPFDEASIQILEAAALSGTVSDAALDALVRDL